MVINIGSCAGVNEEAADIGNGGHLPVSVAVVPSLTHAPAEKHVSGRKPECSRSQRRRVLSNVSEGDLCYFTFCCH